MQTPLPPEAAKEIEYVKSMVARHFPVYDVKISYDVVEFFCRVDEVMLEESFERLRKEMTPQGYVPMITYQKGEHVIIVGKKGRLRYRSVYVNLTTFIVTFLAMTATGVLLWSSYADVPGGELFSLKNIGMGILVFALPLLAILGIHELGHYFVAKKRGVALSFPLFLPAFPPLGALCTMVSFRDPLPDRKSLLEIGMAGPIIGMLVAVPIGVLGFVLTNADAKPIPDEFAIEGSGAILLPLVYGWIESIVPIAGDYLIHPLVVAAWAGFLLTAINLLPSGQLDGGLIARAILGRNAKYAGWATIAVLIALAFLWLYWLILAVVILLFGLAHPPPLNDITKLDTKRSAAGLFVFAIFIITFIPMPTTIIIPDHSVEIEPIDGVSTSITPWESAEFTFWVMNVGNVKNNITVFADNQSTAWIIEFKPLDSPDEGYEDTINSVLDVSENATFSMRVTCGPQPPGEYQLTVVARSELSPEDDPVEARLVYTLFVEPPDIQSWIADKAVSAPIGGNVTALAQINNTGDGDVALVLSAHDLPASTSAYLYEDYLDENSTDRLDITVPANDHATFTVLISVTEFAAPGDWTIAIQAAYFEVVIETMDIEVTVT